MYSGKESRLKGGGAYLEGKRLLRPFKMGRCTQAQHKQIYGVDLIENGGRPTGYNVSRTVFRFITLTFEQKHYKWPIPLVMR